MKSAVISGIVGGIILFLWSFLAWVILPFHTASMHWIPNEDAVISTLQPLLTQKGLYVFPHQPYMKADEASMQAWTAKVKRGPTGMIFYDPSGSDPMMPKQMMMGIFLDFLTAFLAAWMLATSVIATAPYASRVMYFVMIGVLISVSVHLINWNWMGFPTDWTLSLIVDTIFGWTLAGLGISALIKPVHPAAAA
ncbi:MAG TPA: hypothetical protein VKS81_07765 [Bacteroidota bacterium]|nr:hypothetical protein [Bacteroidota bacterium]